VGRLIRRRATASRPTSHHYPSRTLAVNNMPPKKSATSQPAGSFVAADTAPAVPKLSKSTNTSSTNPLTILTSLYDTYQENTPQRTKLIDAFLGFLVLTGGLQFLYCLIAGNYPFNAFLAGFSATVGQFVLTVSLRSQSNPENKSQFSTISPERAFADFVFGSVLLHFFCINFIN